MGIAVFVDLLGTLGEYRNSWIGYDPYCVQDTVFEAAGFIAGEVKKAAGEKGRET